jgi:hypothetical protein
LQRETVQTHFGSAPVCGSDSVERLGGLSADADLLADRTLKAADARWQGVPKPEKFPANITTGTS